jgi:hypothetical protein
MPWDGSLTILGQTTNNFWNDNDAWPDADPGFYAYAVRARYENSDSEWAYSNVAGHLIDNEVTINVTQCDGEEPSGALVSLMGMNYPYQNLSATTPASGTVVFDSVIDGRYNLTINKLGYQTYIHNDIFIFSNYVENAVLVESVYPPRNLYVDPLTSVATWDEPLYIQIPFQGFEEEPFPPAGWQMITTGIGWERVEDGSSSFWTIPSPPAESEDWYAVTNDDQSSGNNQTDYLITPECDLRETETYSFSFISYYDGAYGQPAPQVLYSTDGGANWEELLTLAPAFAWTPITVDISAISGADGLQSVWFALFQDDNNIWGSGWAVDNIYLGNGPVDVEGYHVF